MRTSAVQRRSDFRKKVFGPPILRRSKRGANVRSSQKPYFRKSRRQLHPRRFGPSQESDTGALSIATSQIDATAACKGMGRDARDAHSGACSGPSAWRPASVEAPVARVDKVAHAANSAPVRMRLRSWLRLAKVAGGRCDRFWTMEKRRRECAGCRAQSARFSERYSAMARRQFADLGFLDRFVWHGASAPSANVWR